MKVTTSRITLFTALLIALIMFILFHDLRLIFTGTEWSLPARVLSSLLVFVVLFGIIQFVNYADNLLRSLYAYPEHPIVSKQERAINSVAVFVPVYNEEPDIVESCVQACMEITYPDVHIYLLDDSTDPKKRAMMHGISCRYHLHYIHRDHRQGFKAGAINHALTLLNDKTPYLLVIDADQRVRPMILADLIPILENHPNISFIQTPQYFRSKPKDPISVTFSYQQHIYNKHVCRGLSVNNTTMLTGSNCIFRVDHLITAGGMDETCIAEDIATAFAFHLRGYRGLFLDTVYAEGVAPPNLAAYFTQQFRWAHGNTRLLKKILWQAFKRPGCMPLLQWLEFTVISSIYLFGGMSAALFLLPIATLLLGIPILPVWLPIVFAVVLAVVIAIQVIISIQERNYSLRDLALSQAIFNGLTFVYARAAWSAIAGKQVPFVVTPKRISQSDEQSRVKITLIFLVISSIFVSIFAGIVRLIHGGLEGSVMIPLFWACFTLIILSSFLVVWRRDKRGMTQR